MKIKLALLEQLQGIDRGIDEQLAAQNEHHAAITKLEECVMWANAGVARRS